MIRTRSALLVSLTVLAALASACADESSTTDTPPPPAVPPPSPTPTQSPPQTPPPLPTDPCTAATHCTSFAAGTPEVTIQNAFATAMAGWTFSFAAGSYSFLNALTIGASGVSVIGAGIDKTIFDFSSQASASEGIFAQSVQKLRFEGFTVKDPKGNGVKVLGAKGVVFRKVKVYWTAADASTHGGYGLYPVQSSDVLIEGCVVNGASDSGLYIGQSNNVIVRNNEAAGNVAGIEVENTIAADVYGNDAHDNTAGILIFDLPALQQLGGNAVRVYDNKIHDNNKPNFAPSGNLVASIPSGTGSFVMANHDVELFRNTFTNNGSVQIAVVSYFVTSIAITDDKYYPFPAKVSIHDNTFSGGGEAVDTTTQLGALLSSAQPALPGNRIPDVLYDGVTDPTIATPAENPMQICVTQPGSHIANLHFDQLDAQGSNLASILTVDPAGFGCTLPAVAGVTLP